MTWSTSILSIFQVDIRHQTILHWIVHETAWVCAEMRRKIYHNYTHHSWSLKESLRSERHLADEYYTQRVRIADDAVKDAFLAVLT